MKWYKVGYFLWRDEPMIKAVEVKNEMPQSLKIVRYHAGNPYINIVRKTSHQGDNYFSTFKEAKDFMLARYKEQIESLEEEISEKKAELLRLQTEQEPKED